MKRMMNDFQWSTEIKSVPVEDRALAKSRRIFRELGRRPDFKVSAGSILWPVQHMGEYASKDLLIHQQGSVI